MIFVPCSCLSVFCNLYRYGSQKSGSRFSPVLCWNGEIVVGSRVMYQYFNLIITGFNIIGNVK